MKASLHVIAEMIKKEFLQIRQDRRMLTVSILAPFLQVLLLGYAATTDITNARLVVCDMDGTAESRTFIRRFTTSGYFLERYRVDIPAQADYFIEHAKASMALVIPEGFGREGLNRETAQVQVVLDGTDANSSNILLGYASQVIASYSQEVMENVAAVRLGLRAAQVVPEPRIWFNPDLKSAHYMVPGVVALVLMIITMTLTSLGIVREKEIGTLEQLMVTPITTSALILGKIIPFALIGFVEFSLALFVGIIWFKIPFVGSWVLLYALAFIYLFTTLGTGMFISTITHTQQQAMFFTWFFTIFAILTSGFFTPIANMPQSVQYLTYLNPLRYFIKVVRGIIMKGASLDVLYPEAIAMVIFGVVIFSLSWMRFSKRVK